MPSANSNCTIIRLDTNKGISGYGECRCEDTNSLTELRALKSTILGMNPTQIDKVFSPIKTYGSPFSHQTDTPRHKLQPLVDAGAIEGLCWSNCSPMVALLAWSRAN